jgi:hypothetical protein
MNSMPAGGPMTRYKCRQHCALNPDAKVTMVNGTFLSRLN